ncbi:uncharacterized protein LOC122198117 [Lactuca sativa]|uniref:uncharacterized protein LOC122198117 n=1 Tax=Lactuca sativa TaxID=4236 RepID=UPI001C68D870|nr:uncharacterized protein LOC122198117 [Lactuca sativa]
MKSFESELHALTLRVSICNGWTRIKWRASKGSFLGLGGHSTRKHVSILSKVVGWRCCRREGEARELWGVIAVKVSHHSMSTPNDASGFSSNNNSFKNNFSLLNICSRVIFVATNYNVWMQNIKMALRFEEKEYVLEKELLKIDETKDIAAKIVDYRKHYNDATKVACIMVTTMTPEL